MLKINNLNATIDNKSILNGLSLDINPGEVHEPHQDLYLRIAHLK